jgi:hypothetical protein
MQNTIEELAISFATGGANATNTSTKTLRGDFDRCVGISIVDGNLQSATRVRLKLEDENDNILLETFNIGLIRSTTAVPINGRIYPVNFESKNKKVKATVYYEGSTSGTFTMDIQFHTEKNTN